MQPCKCSSVVKSDILNLEKINNALLVYKIRLESKMYNIIS